MGDGTSGGRAAENVTEQIARLGAEVEALAAAHLGEASHAARHLSASAEREAAALAQTIRERPLTAVLLAAGIGFLLARVAR